jgi:hypothetical protein
MLPAKIPNARIMAFNYESSWLKDAPKQRRSLCADQLLSALDNKRKEVKFVTLRILAKTEFNRMVGERYCISTYHLCWTQLWWYSHRAGSLISHSHGEFFLTY